MTTTETTWIPTTDRSDQRPVLRGAFTALVTPFDADGELDEAALGRLLDHQLGAGIDGLVPCGTTGESPTLEPAERERVIARTVQASREAAGRGDTGRAMVVAGTGSNDTRATIAATRRAEALGADAALVVAPYYNKPDQRMLEAHYRAVADEGGLPIVVYNVPGRTGSNVDAGTLLRLAEHPRIIAVKEASAKRRWRRLGGLERGARGHGPSLRAGARRRARRGTSAPRELPGALPGQLREPQPRARQGRAG
jgi:4-hydroxy-tetrahydrodipicolinate synthase